VLSIETHRKKGIIEKESNSFLENPTKMHGDVIWIWGAVFYSGNMVPNHLATRLDDPWIQSNVTLPNLLHSAVPRTPCGKDSCTSGNLLPSFRAPPNNIPGQDQRSLSHNVPLYRLFAQIRLHGDVTPKRLPLAHLHAMTQNKIISTYRYPYVAVTAKFDTAYE
jgi:hypothetical protein